MKVKKFIEIGFNNPKELLSAILKYIKFVIDNKDDNGGYLEMAIDYTPDYANKGRRYAVKVNDIQMSNDAFHHSISEFRDSVLSKIDMKSSDNREVNIFNYSGRGYCDESKINFDLVNYIEENQDYLTKEISSIFI